jgi:hypothetical protein
MLHVKVSAKRHRAVSASEDNEITKSIIFAHMHQDDRLLVYFAPDLVPNIILFLHIKYTR